MKERKKKIFPVHLLVSCFVMILCMSCESESKVDIGNQSENRTDISLKSIPSSHSGVTFNNSIKENERLHCFIWNFIYQGAGVAIGDINNDGLPDIYMGGNMVSDKLYLNKGNFQFEDISLSSGISDKLWTTGITMVDINNDGWLDIYVCKNFFLIQESVRQNKLFINNGDLTFTESAAEYGINDDGYSINAHFFDAENDGDLDMYLVNQPMDQYAARMARPETLKKLPFSDKLYINNNGKYVDQTGSKGFVTQKYGLSALVADFDKNGFQDLYVCNDYYKGDDFYFNYSELNFQNEIKERIGHSSFYSMGSDMADIDNDGDLDFITLDMAFADHYKSKTNMESMRPDLFDKYVSEGNHYQYPVNNLQVNNGSAYFSDISQMSGVSNTDWSWSALFTDLDNDSHQDLLITNGLLRDLRNNDFINSLKTNNQGNDFRSLLNRIPSNPVRNYVFKNAGNYSFKNISEKAGFVEKTFSSGMAYGDLDGDGDMDIVINNTNQEASIFENLSNNANNYINITLAGPQVNRNGIGATVECHFNNKKTIHVAQPTRGYMSCVQNIIHQGLAQSETMDSIIVYWNDSKKSIITKPKLNTNLTISYDSAVSYTQNKKAKSANPLALSYRHEENAFDDYDAQVLLPYKLSQNGPHISKGDLNDDNIDDLFIGGAKGQASQLFLSQSQGNYSNAPLDLFAQDQDCEVVNSALFDLDQDGDLDIYLAHGGAETKTNLCADLIYINEGKGRFSKYTSELPTLDGEAIAVADINNDGFTDLFVGARTEPGRYPVAPDSKILINNNGTLEDKSQEIAEDLKGLGLITDATFEDIDGDNDLDLLVVGEWMPLTILENRDNKFIKKENRTLDSQRGIFWSLETGDFDQDGDIDILLGNLGQNNKFKPTAENPFVIHAGDLDNNGDHDIVLSKTKNNKLLPVRGRECSSEDMPFIADKFKDFDSYAQASLIDIHNEGSLDNATRYEVQTLSHLFVENLGNMNFEIRTLPIESQVSPIKDFIVQDFNNDGNLDFIFGGNHYPAEVETVRYDAGKGGLFLGDGKGQFKFVDNQESGIFLDKDIRDLELLQINKEYYLIAVSNNDKLEVQELMIKP